MALNLVEIEYVKLLEPELKEAISNGEPDRAASFAKELARLRRKEKTDRESRIHRYHAGGRPMTEQTTTDEPLLIDASGVAKLLSVSRRHVQALDSSGRLPAGISLGRCRRWNAEEIRRWCAAGCPARSAWLAMQQAPRLRIAGGSR